MSEESEILYGCLFFYVKVEKNPHNIPWLKVYDSKGRRELSMCDKETYCAIMEVILVIENMMINYYSAFNIKINHVSLGLIKPVVHWHVIARFPQDPYYPKTVWNDVRTNFNPEDYKSFLETLPSFDVLLDQIKQEMIQAYGPENHSNYPL